MSELREYLVEMHGEVREVYSVEAESEDAAVGRQAVMQGAALAHRGRGRVAARRGIVKRGGYLQRRTELRSSSLLRGSGLSPVSAKRRRQNATYSRLRETFLAEHPRCGFPLGCDEQATEIQHRRGRRGERLCDVAWWAASCHHHNQWAEEFTGEALACGWLVLIEGAA